MTEYKKLLALYKHPFNLVRIGRMCDGGYIVPAELINNNLLTCGISNEISFEEHYLNLIVNPNIHCFDGTIDYFPSNNPAFIWHKMNIDSVDTDTTFCLNTIFDSFFAYQDHVLVKMDIEGGEYPGFETISEENLNKIDCLVVEVHDIEQRYDDFSALMNKLMGSLVLIHKHDNWGGGYFEAEDECFARVYELTFVHKRYIPELEVNDVSLPIPGLDYRN